MIHVNKYKITEDDIPSQQTKAVDFGQVRLHIILGSVYVQTFSDTHYPAMPSYVI